MIEDLMLPFRELFQGVTYTLDEIILMSRSAMLTVGTILKEEATYITMNEFHWSQKSRGAQAIIIATQNRTSNVAVTYDRSVSAAGSMRHPAANSTAIL